jgi:hypothetical protein
MGLLYVLHNPRLLSMLDDFRHTARLPIQVLHVVRENDARDGAISFKSHEINPALQAADPSTPGIRSWFVAAPWMAGGIEIALSILASKGDELPFFSCAAMEKMVGKRQLAPGRTFHV